MPANAVPETHLASGAWCFAGQEETFPDWEERFPLPPDPYQRLEDMEAAAAMANAAMIRLIPVFGQELNELRGMARTPVFWETALSPWLLTALHMFVERRQRVLDLVALHGREALRVPVLPDECAFSFRNSLDFMLHGVQSGVFNHFVFSWIVRDLAPPAWQLTVLPVRTLHQAVPPDEGLKERIRDTLRALPFPRVKGFSMLQSLALSAALFSNRSDNNLTVPLAAYASGALPSDTPVLRALPLLRRCLPLDLAEAPVPKAKNRKGRIRIMAAEFMQNEAYSLQLAAWREGGGRLIDCQHGGNNGNLRCIGSNILDYRQHAHLTWGWKSHTPFAGSFTPVSHPLPAAVADRHAERHKTLILVGTEMSTFTYRLKSRPLASSLVAYRKAKRTFFASLPVEIREHAQYRPYFKVAGGLSDAPYVQQAFPDIPLCSGDLMARLLSCRLSVLDHYGTTMLLALAANVPLICYWDQQRWGMGPETEERLEPLRTAKILHPDAESAAAQAVAVWPDVQGWWRSDAVQQARRQWTEVYAASPVKGTWPLTRHWWQVLRSL